VNTYLKSWGKKYASYFNREGRGFPDVAAQGLFSGPFSFRQLNFLPILTIPYLRPFALAWLNKKTTGNRIPFYDAGAFALTYGTSASAPMVASLVALLNDHRLRHGMPKLGFLNPLLYSQRAKAGGGFHDITEGSNPGCSTGGFRAMKGYVSTPMILRLHADKRNVGYVF
jgi:hypothetical protein